LGKSCYDKETTLQPEVEPTNTTNYR